MLKKEQVKVRNKTKWDSPCFRLCLPRFQKDCERDSAAGIPLSGTLVIPVPGGHIPEQSSCCSISSTQEWRRKGFREQLGIWACVRRRILDIKAGFVRKETSNRILECCCASTCQQSGEKRQGQGNDVFQQTCICNVFVTLMLSHLLCAAAWAGEREGMVPICCSLVRHSILSLPKINRQREGKLCKYISSVPKNING